MSDATRLYRHTFDGPDVPGVVDAWPGFEIPLEQDGARPLVNPQNGLQSGLNAPIEPWVNQPFIPTIDGGGHGIGPFGMSAFAYLWALRSENRPGRQDVRSLVRARWTRPGATTFGQGVGAIARLRSVRDYAVARAVANVDGTPTLRIFTIEDGVETARGDAYSGSGLAENDLAGGVTVELLAIDNDDGTTTLRAYTGGGASRGTERVVWTGAAPSLRGSWGTGVELTGGISGDDVQVTEHAAYDLTDGNDAGLEDGSGWVLELDGTRYTAAAMRAAGVADIEVTQTFPAQGGGCTATLTAPGAWVLSAGLRPMRSVVIYHHGAVRFRGVLVSGSAAAQPAGSQTWTAMDAVTLAGLVDVAEDDGTATIHFNVVDQADDYYRADRQEMTFGDALAFLGERYKSKLALRGAAPTDGGAVFDPAELALLDGVLPGLAVSGSFSAAVFQVLAKVRKWQPFVDPDTRRWHLRDLTDTRPETIECTAEWVKPTVSVDARRAVTAIEFVGTRGETGDETLNLNVPGNANTLNPMWTQGQEDGADASKSTKQEIRGRIVGAGAEAFRGQTRTFILVSASYGLTEDQFRGGICMAQFVVGNTATKVYLAPAAWPGDVAPDPGEPFILTMLDERAQWWLSNMGVGKAFRAPSLSQICGITPTGLAAGGLDRARACGLARIGQVNPETGVVSWEDVDFGVHAPTQEAIEAGYCDPVVVLAKKPERPIGLVNYLGPMPGGSPPLDQCSNPAVAVPEVQIQATIRTLGDVPTARVPAADETYEGRAYTQWGWARLQRISIPDFTSMDQAPGLVLAGQALLDVMGDLPMLFTAQIATPWHPHPKFPQYANGYPTSRFAGLNTNVRLTSARRTTGLEGGLNLVVYSVTWSVFGNTTTIQAGTAAGWLNLAAEEIARTFLEKPAQATQIQQARTMAAIVACLNGQSETTVPAQPSGSIPGCKVEVTDTVRRSTNDVNIDDEHKKSGVAHVHLESGLGAAIAGAGSNPYPGQPIAMPGYDHADGRTWVEGSGSIPRASVETWLPGPVDVARGKAGRYGGPAIGDPRTAGRPPATIAVHRWGTVQKAPDAAGNAAGGQALRWSPNDAQGVPTGAWEPLTSLLQVGAAGVPLRDAAAGSYPAQLAARDAAIAERLGILLDEAGRVILPGTVTADYPDGAPADHVTTLRAAAVASDLRPLWQTLHDPGGLVLYGPVGGGADAGLAWRVLPPGHTLVLVAQVTPGSGRNGGSWADVSGEGALTMLRGGRVVHKQIDAANLAADRGEAVTAPAAPSSSQDPFCFTSHAGRVLPAGESVVSGAGGIVPMPPESVGAIAVTAHLAELRSESPEDAGRAPRLALSYSVAGSEWTAPDETDPQEPALTDGSGTGTAVAQFLVPGGAVPAGLRRPFDLAVSIQRDGDEGDMTGDALLTGLGIDVAVAEQAVLLRAGGSLALGGVARDSRGIARGSLVIGGEAVEAVTESVSGSLLLRGSGRVDPAPWSRAYGRLAIRGSVAVTPDLIVCPGSLAIRGRALGRLNALASVHPGSLVISGTATITEE